MVPMAGMFAKSVSEVLQQMTLFNFVDSIIVQPNKA